MNPRIALAGVILALAVGIGTGYALRGSDSEAPLAQDGAAAVGTDTQPVTPTDPGAPQPRTVDEPPSTRTDNDGEAPATTTGRAPEQRDPDAPTASEPPPVPDDRPRTRPGQSIAGRGDRSIGTITVKRRSLLRWTSEPAGFELYVGGSPQPVIANDADERGEVFLPPGVYRSVRVAAQGRWRLQMLTLIE